MTKTRNSTRLCIEENPSDENGHLRHAITMTTHDTLANEFQCIFNQINFLFSLSNGNRWISMRRRNGFSSLLSLPSRGSFISVNHILYLIEIQGVEIPIFIWYENYLHTGEGYEGRVSRVAQQGSSSHYGLASLNLTRIRESDQGMLNRN